MKILFLAANPPGTARLDLDIEVNKIEDGLQRSKLNGQFQLVSKWAVDSNSLRRALLEENPDIVHFSGHGEGQTGLVLVGQDGQPKPATDEALSGLFKQFPNIKCVLLNACYAEVQAKAIVQHIDYVVGMKQAVRDDAAIAFATGFYDGLGYGKSIDVAFELGCNAVQFEVASFSATTRSRKLIPVDLEKVEPLPDHLIPVLLKKEIDSANSQVSPPSVEVEQELSDSDIQILTDLLIRSGRAAYLARKALCIRIRIDPNQLEFLRQSTDTDFALELINYLHNIDDKQAICKICKELEIVFKRGKYLADLENIKSKINCK